MFEIALSIDREWAALQTLMRKYADRRMSFADACLVRMAELHDEPRIVTLDEDFATCRWAQRRQFRMI